LFQFRFRSVARGENSGFLSGEKIMRGSAKRAVKWCGVAGGFALLAGAAFAQNAPKPSGIPDFAGSETGWIAQGVNFQSPASGPHEVTNDPAHVFKPPGRGEAPTWRIADLSNPILQPWAREELRKRNERILAGGTAY